MILAFQTATTRRETSLTEVVYRQVTALSMVASKSVSRPAVVVQPGKGAFCGPASRQQHKSHGRPPSTPGRHQDGCRQFWSYRLPDPNHRHALAAAVTEAADVVMTFNLKMIPAAALAPHGGMASQHPDAFLRSYIVAGPVQVLAGVEERLARPTNPPHSAFGLTGTAAFLDDN